jgi:hypothetical protein
MCFNKSISESRFEEIKLELSNVLGGWLPKNTNRMQLYDASGKVWKYEDSKDQSVCIDKRFSDMPQKAIDYLKSLPEFDAEIFKKITGIDVQSPDSNQEICGKVVEIDGKKYKLMEV